MSDKECSVILCEGGIWECQRDTLTQRLKEVEAERDRLQSLLSPGGRQEYLLLEQRDKLAARLALAEDVLVDALEFITQDPSYTIGGVKGAVRGDLEDCRYVATEALAKWREGNKK